MDKLDAYVMNSRAVSTLRLKIISLAKLVALADDDDEIKGEVKPLMDKLLEAEELATQLLIDLEVPEAEGVMEAWVEEGIAAGRRFICRMRPAG